MKKNRTVLNRTTLPKQILLVCCTALLAASCSTSRLSGRHPASTGSDEPVLVDPSTIGTVAPPSVPPDVVDQFFASSDILTPQWASEMQAVEPALTYEDYTAGTGVAAGCKAGYTKLEYKVGPLDFTDFTGEHGVEINGRYAGDCSKLRDPKTLGNAAGIYPEANYRVSLQNNCSDSYVLNAIRGVTKQVTCVVNSPNTLTIATWYNSGAYVMDINYCCKKIVPCAVSIGGSGN